MNAQLSTTRPRLDHTDELSHFCTDIFESLPRSDQRRWGEVYLRGLLSVAGRKSIRRISNQVVGRRADQSLQQFVNQSPWRWHGVRSTVARQASVIRPRAWLVQEAIFPKHGDRSVGVAKQYAPSAGRTLNCQVGIAVSLAGDRDRCAVNWRLVLPSSWDRDTERRSRARVPAGVRHRPHWWYVFDAIDEMTTDWGLRPSPIIWHATDEEVRPLLLGLADRRLPYLVRVSEHAPVLEAGQAGAVRALTAGDLAEISAKRRHVMLRVRTGNGDTNAVHQYSLLSICDMCPPDRRVQVTSPCQHGGTRRVLAQWSWRNADGHLSGVWLTNLTTASINQLVDLAELGRKSRREDMATLRDEFGLHDFEGRSYAGWHHHVTLVSAAQAYHMLHIPAKSTSEGRVDSPLVN